MFLIKLKRSNQPHLWALLDDLGLKNFFVAQPWWVTFFIYFLRIDFSLLIRTLTFIKNPYKLSPGIIFELHTV